MIRSITIFFLMVLSITSCNESEEIVKIKTNRYAEGPGCNCTKGGYKIESGRDANKNNQLDREEIESITYVCIGATKSESAAVVSIIIYIFLGSIFVFLVAYTLWDYFSRGKPTSDKNLFDDANCLLNWALKRNVQIDKRHINAILNFQRVVNSPDHTDFKKLKSSFLKSYENIAERTGTVEVNDVPVNVQSVLDIQRKYPVKLFFYLKLPILRISKAIRTLVNFQIWLFIVLIMALSIQFYWFNGTSYYNDYVSLSERIVSAKDELALNPSDSLERVKLQNDIMAFESDKIDVLIGLCKWEALASYDPDDRQRLNFANLSCCPDNAANISNIEQKIIRSVKIKLRLCDSYLLPLLYGLLGAIVYSLRNITSEIANYQLKSTSKNRYLTRLYLGAFAGIAIGWFRNNITTELLSFGESLTPVVLSFIAGYSIEVFFNLVDRNIKSTKSNDKGDT